MVEPFVEQIVSATFERQIFTEEQGLIAVRFPSTCCR